MIDISLEDWLNIPQQVVFSHTKCPPELPSDQLNDILVRVKSTCPYATHVKAVVADQTERDLLIAEMTARHPLQTGAENFSVHNYAELLRDMGAGSWVWEPESLMVLVCRVDINYSAAYALFMTKLLYWANAPTSTTRLRVLTMSEKDWLESAVKGAMVHLAPTLEIFRITLPSDAPPRAITPLPITHTKEINPTGIVQGIIQYLKQRLGSGHSVVVHCSLAEASDIEAGLRASETPYHAAVNSESGVQDLIRAIQVRTDASVAMPGLLLFLLERARVPFNIPKLSAVIVSGTRSACHWQNGRVVHADEATSKYEIVSLRNQLMQYRVESTVRFVMPSDDETGLVRGRYPPRRLTREQSWGFVASVAFEFPGADTMPIIGAFVDDPIAFKCVMNQLNHMECLFRCPTEPDQLLHFDSQAASYLVRFLPHVQHDIRVAWFLALGMSSETASIPAKRAMAHIAALLCHGFPILDKLRISRLHENAPQVMQDLRAFLGDTFSMPDRLYMKGILWISLAVWQQVCATPNFYAEEEEDCDDIDLMGNDVFVIKANMCRLVRNALVGLVRDTPLEALVDHRPLHLSEDDISNVYSIMIKCWMHESFIVNRDPDNVENFVIIDAVARTGIQYDFALSNGPLQMFDDEQSSRSALIMPRRVERNGPFNLLLQDAVSIPLQEVSRWQQLHQCRFVDAVAFTYP